MDAKAPRSRQIDQQQIPISSDQPKAQILPENENIQNKKKPASNLVNEKYTGTFANKHRTAKVQSKKNNSNSCISSANLSEAAKTDKANKLSRRFIAKAIVESKTEAIPFVIIKDILKDTQFFSSLASDYGKNIFEILGYVNTRPNYLNKLFIQDINNLINGWKKHYPKFVQVFLEAYTCKSSFNILNVEQQTFLKLRLINGLYKVIEVWEYVSVGLNGILTNLNNQKLFNMLNSYQEAVSDFKQFFRNFIDECVLLYINFTGSSLKDSELIHVSNIESTEIGNSNRYLFYVNKNCNPNEISSGNRAYIAITYLYADHPLDLKFKGGNLFYKEFNLSNTATLESIQQGVLFKKIDDAGHLEIVDTPGMIVGFERLKGSFMHYNPKQWNSEESMDPYTCRTGEVCRDYADIEEYSKEWYSNPNNTESHVLNAFVEEMNAFFNTYPIKKDQKLALLNDMLNKGLKLGEYQFKPFYSSSSEISVDRIQEFKSLLASLTFIQFEEYAYLLLTHISDVQWTHLANHPIRKALEQAYPNSTQADIKQVIEADLELAYIEEWSQNPSQATINKLAVIDKEAEVSIESMYVADTVIIEEAVNIAQAESSEKDSIQKEDTPVELQKSKEEQPVTAEYEAWNHKKQAKWRAKRVNIQAEAEKKKKDVLVAEAKKSASLKLRLLKSQVISSGPLKNVGDLKKVINEMVFLLEGTNLKLSSTSGTGSHRKFEVTNTSSSGETHTVSSIVAMPHKKSARHSLQQGVIGILDNLIQESSV